MKDPVRLSVVVPCYNEEKNVSEVLKNFAPVFARTKQAELILVDNGSLDETGKVIDRELAGNGYGFARKVTVPQNRGYGFGILSGLRESSGEILGWTHADLQTDPADVLRAYELYLEGSKGGQRLLVKGHRKNRKPLEKFFSLGMQILAWGVLGTWLVEINAQPKLFSRGLYEEMTAPPEDFSLDLYLLYLAKKRGYKTVSVPVDFKDRVHGEAKGGGGGFKNRWKLIERTVRFIFKLKSKISEKKAG